jgi:hypothetical protein
MPKQSSEKSANFQLFQMSLRFDIRDKYVEQVMVLGVEKHQLFEWIPLQYD